MALRDTPLDLGSYFLGYNPYFEKAVDVANIAFLFYLGFSFFSFLGGRTLTETVST